MADQQQTKKRKAPVNIKILLDQVNAVREACAIGEGKLTELPPGEMSDAEQCVIARALSNGWHAEVAEMVELIHSGTPVPDFHACASALRKRGFKNVSVLGHWGCDIGVTFEPTQTMCNFIERFDAGDFPHLILERG